MSPEKNERLPKPNIHFWRRPGQSIIINPGLDNEITITVGDIKKGPEAQPINENHHCQNEVMIVFEDVNDVKAVFFIHSRQDNKIIRTELIDKQETPESLKAAARLASF